MACYLPLKSTCVNHLASLQTPMHCGDSFLGFAYTSWFPLCHGDPARSDSRTLWNQKQRKTWSSGVCLGPWPPSWFAAQPRTRATYLGLSPIPKANILLTHSHLGLPFPGSYAEGCLVSLIPWCIALGHALLAQPFCSEKQTNIEEIVEGTKFWLGFLFLFFHRRESLGLLAFSNPMVSLRFQ